MAVQNEFENKRSKTLRWGYFFAGFAFVLFMIFLARIIVLQNTNVQEIKDDYINKNYREASLKAQSPQPRQASPSPMLSLQLKAKKCMRLPLALYTQA